MIDLLFAFPPISKLSEVKPQEKGLILIDIDGTVLKEEAGPDKGVLIDAGAPGIWKRWKDAGCKVHFFTSRRGDVQDALADLTKAGFNNVKKEDIWMTQGVAKGDWLQQRHLRLPLGTIYVDNHEYQLSNVKGQVSNVAPFYFGKWEKGFPDSLETYEQGIGFDEGGNQSVFRLKKEGAEQPYVLKKTSEKITDKKQARDVLKEEILADGIYEAISKNNILPNNPFGVHIIPFSVYHKIGQESGLFRVSTFIEGYNFSPDHAPADDDKTNIKKGFIVDAFMGNWDLPVKGGKNFRKSAQDGTIYRMDNGGSLRYRAMGEPKHGKEGYDVNDAVSDLYTMRGQDYIVGEQINVKKPNNAQDFTNFYGDLTDEEILSQIENLVKLEDIILETADRYNRWLEIDKYDELRLILQKRLTSLKEFWHDQMRFKELDKYREADAFDIATNNTSAGVLVWAKDPNDANKIKVLLGKRAGNHDWWGNFGGKSIDDNGRVEDKTLLQTAVRETDEESMGLFSFAEKDLYAKPSHDLVSNGMLYRTYIAEHSFIDPQIFSNKLAEQTDVHKKEYIDFVWAPLEGLLKIVEDNLRACFLIIYLF